MNSATRRAGKRSGWWCLLGWLPALAGATLGENLSIGNPRALSLAHAVTADPPGVDAIHFNPAGLARLAGGQAALAWISGGFDVELKFGGYTPTRSAFINAQQQKGYFPDDYFEDVAVNTTSHTEGVTLMLPGEGLTDLSALILPRGAVSAEISGTPYTVGTSVHAPLKAGFHRASDDTGRFIGERLAFTVLSYAAPAVGWRVNDRLSLGAALTVNYAGVGMELPFRSANTGIPLLFDLTEQACDPNDGIPGAVQCIPRDQRIRFNDELGRLEFEVDQTVTPGLNLGMLFDITPKLRVGAVYQSPVRMDMSGDFSWRSGETLQQFVAGFLASDPTAGQSVVDGRAHMDLTLPEHVSLGVSVAVNDRLRVNVDGKFSRWSRWQTIPVTFSEKIDVLRIAALLQPDYAGADTVILPFGLEDTWNVAVGAEYALTPQWQLRAGLEDRPSSIPSDARSPLFPMGSGTLTCLGFGYAPTPSQQVDVAIAHFSSRTHMPGNTSVLGNSEDPSLFIYNPYPGTDIRARLETVLLEAGYQWRW